MPALSWRGMHPHDIPAVSDLGGAVYPSQLWEGETAFAARLAIGAGLVLADDGGALHGYLLCHPWDDSAPPLTARLDAAPRPTTLFLHDIALRPAARGQGHANAAVARFLAWARLFPSSSLVALDATAARFWRARGWRPARDCSDVYLPGATLMRRAA